MSRRPSPHDLLHHLTVVLSGVTTSFKRVRRWSPRSVAVMLLTRPDVRSSYATVLTDLAQESCRALGVVAATTKSSLSVARKKVSVAVFRQVLHQLADHFGRLLPGDFGHHTDRRFFAVDATSLVSPRAFDRRGSLDDHQSTITTAVGQRSGWASIWYSSCACGVSSRTQPLLTLACICGLGPV